MTKNQPHREATKLARQCALWAVDSTNRKKQRHASSQKDLHRREQKPMQLLLGIIHTPKVSTVGVQSPISEVV